MSVVVLAIAALAAPAKLKFLEKIDKPNDTATPALARRHRDLPIGATCRSACIAGGGGGGTFKAGALTLSRSDVVVTIEAGAALAGDPSKVKQCSDEKDWRGWCAFLTVKSERNFTLRGGGTLEQGGSQGAPFISCTCTKFHLSS